MLPPTRLDRALKSKDNRVDPYKALLIFYFIVYFGMLISLFIFN